MGQITEYAAMGAAPAVTDKLFIADASATAPFEIKSITIANLNKMANLAADTVSGLNIKDSGGNYGIFINDGKVGIGPGAANAASYLHVEGASDADVTLARFLNPSATTDGKFQQILFGTASASYKSVALRYYYDTTNNDARFSIQHYEDVAGVAGLHLLGDGNVGINTSAPADLLEIKGNAGFLQMNFPSDASYSGIKFAEAGTAKGYIRSMGSNWTTSARQNMLELASTAGISFWPDNSVADVVINTAGNLGVGTTSPAALVHIEGTANILYLNASSGNCSMRLSNNGASTAYIINSTNNIYIGAPSAAPSTTFQANTAAALQIQKSSGKLNVGSQVNWFTYPLTVGDSDDTSGSDGKATLAAFAGRNTDTSGDNTGRTHLLISNPTVNPQMGIVFESTNASGDFEWLVGSFFDDDTADTAINYFGWRNIDAQGYGSPDSAVFHTTLASNTAYLNATTGGFSCANTAVAFGTCLGAGTGSGMTKTGDYNITSVARSSATQALITFDKAINNTTYTVVAHGYDGTGTQVIVGIPGTQTATTCQVDFYPTASLDIENTNVEWSFVIYGGKLKATTA